MFQSSTRHLKAALAGVLLAWLGLLQGAFGVANLGPEVRDPANFLPPRILVRADVTTSIKPSRPQTLDRQRTASGIPDFLSRDPLGEKESLNLYQLTGGDPINYVDADGLAKVALDGKGNLTTIGQIILDIAIGDPNAARSLLMAKQVDAESAGIKVAGDGGKDPIRNVMEAIETAVGTAQSDGRREWQRIAAEAGLSGESSFGGYKDAWMSTKLAEYAPQIAANAQAAIQLRAVERAANEKSTIEQNSPGYKLREIGGAIADMPGHLAAFGLSAAMATDVTTGNTLTWNGWGSGFGFQEVSPGERVAAAGLMFLPIGRVGGVADDVARVGLRAERSFAGTALRPWANMLTTGADDAVFWSGLGRGGDATAARWVAHNGGVTLETTLVTRGVKLPVWDAGNPASIAAWKQASVNFASGARGNIRVLQGNSLRIDAIWVDEFKALIANPNVNTIRSINPLTGGEAPLWPR